MTLNIQYKNKREDLRKDIRVKIIKAPLVDSNVLRSVITERARALVL